MTLAKTEQFSEIPKEGSLAYRLRRIEIDKSKSPEEKRSGYKEVLEEFKDHELIQRAVLGVDSIPAVYKKHYDNYNAWLLALPHYRSFSEQDRKELLQLIEIIGYVPFDKWDTLLSNPVSAVVVGGTIVPSVDGIVYKLLRKKVSRRELLRDAVFGALAFGGLTIIVTQIKADNFGRAEYKAKYVQSRIEEVYR